jgi:hypothetical protein
MSAKAPVRAPMGFDAPMIAAIVSVAAVALLLSVGTIFAAGWASAIGVAVGGLAATLNLFVFAHVGRNVLAGGRRKRIWGALGGLKLLALFGGLYVLLNSGIISGITLAVGYAAMPLGIALASLVGPRPGDDDETLPEAGGARRTDLVTAARTTAPRTTQSMSREAKS